VAVTEAHGRQCAISDGKVLPALDAAHIKPYSDGGLHAESNGILLRKDIHSVFDAGYATIGEKYCFSVSKKSKIFLITARNICVCTGKFFDFRIGDLIGLTQFFFAGIIQTDMWDKSFDNTAAKCCIAY
jgi:hypothetical protein